MKKISNLILNNDIFIFDLDKTIWNCYDSGGNSIWAKNLERNTFIRITNNLVIDKHNSICILHDGIRETLELLEKKDKKIGFLSVGALLDIKYEQQPSVDLLRTFGIYEYFNFNNYLLYKTKEKDPYLKQYEKCVFFDDDEKHLDKVRDIDSITEIDRKSFLSWKQLI